MWKKLTTTNYSEIESKLNAIAEIIPIESKNYSGYGLLSGNVGSAIFLYYYYLYTKNEIYYEKANTILLEGIRLAKGQHPIDYSYCNGQSGLFWSLTFLDDLEIIDCKIDDILLVKDKDFFEVLKREFTEKGFDYLHHGLGIGAYFNKSSAIKCLSKEVEDWILDFLEREAIHHSEGIFWKSDVFLGNEYCKGINLGLSHGIPSIIIYLCNIFNTTERKYLIKQLVTKSLRYLKSITQDPRKIGSTYPSYITNSNKTAKSRLGWCYGDLGIAIAFYKASKIFCNNEWEDFAINLVKQTAIRRDPVHENIHDAGFCHGSSGLLHIYNKFYQWTGEKIFKETAEYWLSDTLSKDIHEDGNAGYKFYLAEEYGGWTNNYGLLNGISGIGLSLLSSISDIEPNWDECLMLNI